MAMGRDEFVISGMSCRLPKSDSIAEFQENLFTGVDMLESDVVRYNSGNFALPLQLLHLFHMTLAFRFLRIA